MKNYGKVKSSFLPEETKINATSVEIASNIEAYEEEVEGIIIEGYIYDYVVYDKDEYIKMLDAANKQLEAQLLDTQAALCDIYEAVIG